VNSPAPTQPDAPPPDLGPPGPAPPLRAFGRELRYQQPPLCPEIGLWLLGDEIDLEACCLKLPEIQRPPFWAFCWGSGQALARFVLDRPATLRGLRVVDFGAGSGVAGIAAGLAGAASVVAVDTDPDALTAASCNAECNGVDLQTRRSLPADWDLLLASDVLYEPGHLARLQALARPDRPVWLSDPERPSSPRLDPEARARYAVRTLPDVDSPADSAAVFEFLGDPASPASAP
jgi:predicted nicotinamide N-methyase